jgi:hypothetical protein
VNNPGPISGTGIYTDQFIAGGPQTGVTIDGNRFVNAQNAAVLLGSTLDFSQSHFTVSNNTFDTVGNAILLGDLTDSVVRRNTAANMTASTIVISKSVKNLAINENVLQNGMTRGFRFGDFGFGSQPDTGVTATCNSISGFPTSGLEVAAGTFADTLDARFNWWGAASGPKIASNPGGTGEVLVDPDTVVSYSNFLTDGTDSDPATPGFQCVPKLSVADASAVEGNSATTPFGFTVTMNNPSPSPVSVAYVTQDGTATAGSDYQSAADVLTFASGETSKTVSVQVTGDGAVEPDETFTLKLVNPSGATIADGSATGTIQNDDAAPAVTTPPPPSNPADTKRPVVSLKITRAKLAKALKKGLAVRLTSDEAGNATVVAKVGRKVVATGKVKFSAPGTKRVVLKFTKKAKAKYKKARRLKLSVRGRVVDAAGNAGSKTVRVALKR